MPTYRENPDAGCCPWTTATLVQMVTYIRSDDQIAKYLGLKVPRVRQARARLPQWHPFSLAGLGRTRV